MAPAVVVTLVVVALVATALLLVFRGRRAPHDMASLDPDVTTAVVATEQAMDLEMVIADAGAALYIPVDSGSRYLAVARPEAEIVGRPSSVPSQLAGVAVAGQAGLEAMVKAGQLSARLVLVDDKTAKAIKSGTMVTDKAGDLLGIIRGSGGKWSDLTRIKPLSGGLVRSASAGPAVMSAIAMQAQLAQVEKSISEVRDAVNSVKGHLEAAERAAVEGRRETLATVYRTAQDAGQMTQSLWDQIQDLEAPLRRDVKLADHHLEEEVRKLEQGANGLVGSRLKWLEEASGPSGPLAAAVAGVADARRSLVQFSILRLWWLAVTGDPTLASRQVQLRELLSELPDHAEDRERTDAVLAAAGQLHLHHRVLAPRKHKQVAPGVVNAQLKTHQLPWAIVDIRPGSELAMRHAT